MGGGGGGGLVGDRGGGSDILPFSSRDTLLLQRARRWRGMRGAEAGGSLDSQSSRQMTHPPRGTCGFRAPAGHRKGSNSRSYSQRLLPHPHPSLPLLSLSPVPSPSTPNASPSIPPPPLPLLLPPPLSGEGRGCGCESWGDSERLVH